MCNAYLPIKQISRKKYSLIFKINIIHYYVNDVSIVVVFINININNI